MYWCKIAESKQEFQEIFKLNYETFVEEIPQHEQNVERMLIDRFHNENTYVVVYKNEELVDMIAFRDQRPFSLDEKIGDVTSFVEPIFCEKICEVRLLAVKKPYRNGRVFIQLGKALYQYIYTRGYTAAFISGTTREEKLYKHLGFEQIAPTVGKEGAYFLPMVLTRNKSEQVASLFKVEKHTFFPGPVEQIQPLQHTNLSHRSPIFQYSYQSLKRQLLQLSKAQQVAIAVGSGTLANEMMLSKLTTDFAQHNGLIISNGEFGERLAKQATTLGLSFHHIKLAWGESFPLQLIKQAIQLHSVQWITFVHGETSTGHLNPLEDLSALARQYKIVLCADCISSFGSIAFSMESLYMATAVSGKCIGALGGLAFVFGNEIRHQPAHGTYTNIERYLCAEPPFTVPAFLIASCLQALEMYDKRYEILSNRMKLVLESPFAKFLLHVDAHYHAIFTFHFPKQLQQFGHIARLNGLYVHDESKYLLAKQLLQISCIQPNFEKSFHKLCQLLEQAEGVVENI